MTRIPAIKPVNAEIARQEILLFSLRHFQDLAASSCKLGLSPADRARFLWSYYGSRIPGAESRRSFVQEIVIRNQIRPLRFAIRANGCDLDIVDEVFARKVYACDITGVKTILDLGGNIGSASAYFHLQFPDAKLACVEPVPSNLKVLRRNIELNRLPIRLFEAAVAPEDGSTQFNVRRDTAAGSAAYCGSTGFDSEETITVKAISVPTLLEELAWDRIDLLKLDIEGGERELLSANADWLKRVGTIIGEGHHGYGAKYTVQHVVEQLRPFGFQVKLLEQRSGAFVFAADSDRIQSLPARLEVERDPLFPPAP